MVWVYDRNTHILSLQVYFPLIAGHHLLVEPDYDWCPIQYPHKRLFPALFFHYMPYTGILLRYNGLAHRIVYSHQRCNAMIIYETRMVFLQDS